MRCLQKTVHPQPSSPPVQPALQRKHEPTMTVHRFARPALLAFGITCAALLTTACQEPPPADRVRASGQVEATEVRVAAVVAGRVLERPVAEGQRIEAGALIAKL